MVRRGCGGVGLRVPEGGLLLVRGRLGATSTILEHEQQVSKRILMSQYVLIEGIMVRLLANTRRYR